MRYGKDDRPSLKLVNKGQTKGIGNFLSQGKYNNSVNPPTQVS